MTPHRPRNSGQPGTEQKSAVRRAVVDMLALQTPGEDGGSKRGTVRLSTEMTNNEAMLSAQGCVTELCF